MDEGRRRQNCARVIRNLEDFEREQSVLRQRKPNLERALNAERSELQQKENELRVMRAIANTANITSRLPLGGGVVGRVMRDGVSALTGVNAARKADQLERVVERLRNATGSGERELAEISRRLAELRRLMERSRSVLIDNNCGFPNF